MYAVLVFKAAALLGALLPGVFLDQWRKPPTPPDVLLAEITDQLLASYKRALAATIEWRKGYEQTPGTRVAEIARLKEYEADFRRRIERLEQGMLAPPSPVMPVVPQVRIRPPIRD